MRINSTVKLFFAILGSCAIVLIINGIIGYISFNRGFLDYLNDQAIERMRDIVPRFEKAYQQHGDWDFIHEMPYEGFALMGPDLSNYKDKNLPILAPPVSDQTGAVFRIALLDGNGELLFGNPNATQNAIKLAITVDNKTVGWLAMVPFQKVINESDMQFYQQQIRIWWIIGLISVLIAALLAWVFSRALIKRIKKLTDTIHSLANGDFTHRITISNDDELTVLANDVNNLANILENTENNRRNFMADISHELRTPLTVIRAELEAIQDGIRPYDPATITMLQNQVDQLAKLINDFHDLSVTQSGEFSYRFNIIDINHLLQTSLERMQTNISDASLTLNYQSPNIPILIRGDEMRLHQLFSNLIENSIRYTTANGRLLVSIEIEQSRRCRIIIEDSEPGVDEYAIERIFQRFFRVETSRNRSSGGSGLGLAICRNIVETHRGTIKAEPSQLGGLRIVILLPMELT